MTNLEWGRPARESLYKNLAGMVHDLAWYDSGIWVVEQNELVVSMAKILKEIDPSFNIPLFIDNAMRRSNANDDVVKGAISTGHEDLDVLFNKETP